jgi:hypothetical protein
MRLAMRSAVAVLAVLLVGCASSSVGTRDGGGGDGDGGGTGDAGPGQPDAPPGVEVCNGIDDDGDQFVDEGGDELCMPVPPNAIPQCNGLGGCRIGGCNGGFVDLDNNYGNGCECAQEAGENGATDCTAFVDLGTVNDDASQLMVVGNLAPAGDVDWFRFLAADSPDTLCDNFHVRVRVVDDPNFEFLVEVWRGGCGGTQICTGSTDVQWYTNFQGPGAPPTGQCPCTDPSVPSATVNTCEDDSAEYIVKVTRTVGMPASCNNYTLEISNGAYAAP